MKRIRFVLPALIIFAVPAAAIAQTTVTLNATSGSNVISQGYSTSGGLTLNMGFFSEYLMVGGGGGGGGSSNFQNGELAGGGGAGGLLTNVGTPLQITNQSYAVTVGGGGAGASGPTRGSGGGNSSVFGQTAIGGGGGGGASTGAGTTNRNGGSGGSGGGGGHDGGAGTGGSGTAGQGNVGGAGVQPSPNGSGGGGGGAGAVGSAGSGANGGAGGAGAVNTITGSAVFYAGGGGGGSLGGSLNGAGGIGGGGTGRTSGGAVNTGGGGGSGNFAGGSGIVIVRYQGSPMATGGNPTAGTGSAAGYTVHTFLSGSGNLDFSGLNLDTRLGAKVTGVITGNGPLTYNGPGKLILSNNSTYSGSTTIAAGTLQLGDGSTQGAINSNIVVNNGMLIFNRSNALRLEAAISGSGGLVQQGTGRTTLTGSSTYSGGTTINAGSVSTTAANRLPIQGLVTVGGSTSLTLGGDQTLGGLAGTGTVAIASFRLTLGASSGTFAGSILGTGGITKEGAGALTLTGSNAFTGDTFVNGGTLVISNTRALDPFAIVSTGTGGTLQVNQNTRVGYYENSGSLTGSGTLTSAYTLTNSGTLGSPIADSGGASGVLKRTSGTSVLDAANTYTGPTRVDAGRLELGASGSVTATSSLIVNTTGEFATNGKSPTFSSVQNNGLLALAGGTASITGLLSGTGTIQGSVAVSGLHSPGNSPGIESITGNVTYASGAGVLWELADNTVANSPVAYDQIVVGGDLAFTSATDISLSFDSAGSLVDWEDAFWDSDRTWTIWDVTGTTSGLGSLAISGTNWLDGFGVAFGDARPLANFTLAQQGSDVVLTYTAVPEPSTIALVAVGAAALAAVATRRRR